MHKYLSLILFLFGCANSLAQQDLTKYVDPFIGTSGHGHTFPGATVPFGMVQLSPDTGTKDWDWCSGYHSSDSSIIGFSHKHLSGTGGADLGDILLMPTVGQVNFNPGTKENPDSGYRSRFSHTTEYASPGYYSVYLQDYKVVAELTATERAGLHKYTYPESSNSNIVIDLNHGISDVVTEAYINIVSPTKLEGLRRSKGWAIDQHVFFAIELSKPFDQIHLAKDDVELEQTNKIEGKNVKAVLTFTTKADEAIIAKVGLSSVDTKGAWNNLNEEMLNNDFDAIKEQASDKWNKVLNRIVVEGGSQEQRTVFYTALYHSMIAPNIFMDADKRYRGMDKKIHIAEDHNHYTLFSLWDTFRATHPLFTLIDQKRTNDFIKTLYYKYTQFGNLPVWELDANETWCMIGYHSVPVIIDAYMKGIIDYDVNDVYDAIKVTSMKDINGLKYLKDMDYIPMDCEPDAASKTLEYAYDDWCIAQMAKKLGKNDDYNYYTHRAMNYRNIFDTTTSFMRGRNLNGTWKTNFNPAEPFPLGAGEFTEGSSWQYTWFVPQDINGLINQMGGIINFENKLDQLFQAPADDKYVMPSDVTGLIGQYAHGNEPSHHIPYLYNFVGKPYKTADKVREIMSGLYHTGRDGLCGNEDCGQMSAWYVFSAMGFYPVTPASNKYIIGSPIFDKVTINLENGKQVIIKASNNSETNKYVQSITFNGEKYNKSFITHNMLKNGGEILFNMHANPSDTFGISDSDMPTSSISEQFVPIEEKWLFPPYAESIKYVFQDSGKVELKCFSKDAIIKYTTDGTEPSIISTQYTSPLLLNKTTKVRAKSFKDGFPPGTEFNQTYSRAIHRSGESSKNLTSDKQFPAVKLPNKCNRQYTGGSDYAIIDGITGTTSFKDGKWLGIQEQDLIAEIDLGRSIDISNVSARYLRDHSPWIFYPKEVCFYKSEDGVSYTEVQSIGIIDSVHFGGPEIKLVSASYNTSTRYIRVIAKNINDIPSWHNAEGYKAFIFCDEIIIEPK